MASKSLKNLTAPLSGNNPVIVQILGICSALAVTVQLKPAIVMGLSVMVVTAFANLVMSLLRKGVPSRIRIIVQLVVIASLVILVDQVLKAFVYSAYCCGACTCVFGYIIIVFSFVKLSGNEISL